MHIKKKTIGIICWNGSKCQIIFFMHLLGVWKISLNTAIQMSVLKLGPCNSFNDFYSMPNIMNINHVNIKLNWIWKENFRFNSCWYHDVIHTTANHSAVQVDTRLTYEWIIWSKNLVPIYSYIANSIYVHAACFHTSDVTLWYLWMEMMDICSAWWNIFIHTLPPNVVTKSISHTQSDKFMHSDHY